MALVAKAISEGPDGTVQMLSHARIQNDLSEGDPNLITFFFLIFLIDGGIEDPNTAINGPPSARHRNAIEMAFRWRADAGPTLNAGLVAL